MIGADVTIAEGVIGDALGCSVYGAGLLLRAVAGRLSRPVACGRCGWLLRIDRERCGGCGS